jgi:ZIP family zinc transporter
VDEDAQEAVAAGTTSSGSQQQQALSKAAHAKREARRKVLMSGLITALGIALHNFPEGVAVFLASLKSPSIGVSLAVAIALHNIPEGVAVALPVYFATGSRTRGFLYAFVSGLAEPAAVVVLGIMLRAFYLDKTVIDCLLAAVSLLCHL